MCYNPSVIFFSVREIDHPPNISMNRTVEQRAGNSGEKKNCSKNLNEAPNTISIGLIFREVKCVVVVTMIVVCSLSSFAYT